MPNTACSVLPLSASELCCAVLCYASLNYSILLCVVLCCIVMYCVVLCFAVFFCTALCCVVMWCNVLFFSVLQEDAHHGGAHTSRRRHAGRHSSYGGQALQRHCRPGWSNRLHAVCVLLRGRFIDTSLSSLLAAVKWCNEGAGNSDYFFCVLCLKPV